MRYSRTIEDTRITCCRDFLKDYRMYVDTYSSDLLEEWTSGIVVPITCWTTIRDTRDTCSDELSGFWTGLSHWC